MKNIHPKTAFIFCTVLLLNIWLLFSLYQRTWAPHEDGYFAHVAERLLQGEKLYRDIESRHAGYIHFVNAAAMSLWGPTLAVPRIPVIFLTLIQSVILFCLFTPNGLLAAVLVSLTSTILGFLQCLTPSTHWYCIFFLALMILVLLKMPKNRALRIPLLGFLLGLLILFRQLTGFFAGAGLLVYLFTEESASEEKHGALLARALLILTGAVLFINFAETFEINGFLLFGLWPCFLLLWAFVHTRVSDHRVIALCLQLSAGLLLAFLPLAIYLLVHQSFLLWVDDTLIRSAKMLNATPFESWSSYAMYQVGGALRIYHHENLRLTVNGFYWFLLPLLSFLNGCLIFVTLLKRKTLSGKDALPVMIVFYSIVSYTLQIPIYLYYSVSLSLVSLIWISRNHFRRLFAPVSLISIFLLLTGFYFHAGQPCQRGIHGMLEGERMNLSAPEELPKLGLKIQSSHSETYHQLNDFIRLKTATTDPIFVFPNNPEIYFLLGRKNPYRFTLTPTALQSTADVGKVSALLRSTPPKLIFYDSEDKYNTPFGLMLLEAIKKDYVLRKKIAPFEIYERKP